MDREPKQVLLRIFGNTLSTPVDSETPESFMTGIVTENVIFAILSERKLGPKLLGVFAGGRLEEYIPAKSLSTSQLRKKAISQTLARKMARIHKVQVPITTNPGWIFKSLERYINKISLIIFFLENSNFNLILRWQESIAGILLEEIGDVQERNCASRLLDINFVEEIAWVK